MLTAGARLGRYEIRSKLGEGGMGEVYLAWDTKLDRNIAMKVLPADVAADRGRMSRFVQEAKAASGLNHPNILTIYEIDEADSVHFIATEFIDGETLRERMRDAPQKLSDVLDITAQIASALSAAHAAGIVHRDIKPENIMLRRDGIAKVLDFGLAKLTERPLPDSVDSEAPTSYKTEPGTVVGTRAYMSPEQARGMPIDARTDIFSLGDVLYEMVAGRLPFEGTTSSEVVASLLSEKEPQPLARYSREAPTELERIVSKALRKNKDERYQTIKDLLIDLKDLKRELELQAQLERRAQRELPAGEKTEGSGPTTAETQAEATRNSADATARTTSSAHYIASQIERHKRGVVLALAILIIAGAGVAYWLYQGSGRSKSSHALKMTRLTSTGRATNAAISPDGKYVVYATDEAGQQSLWLSQVAISSNVQIVPSAEVNYLGVTFSRDGNLIYYVRNEQTNLGVLYQAPALGGGGERKLLVNVNSPVTLSPDGKRLAFVRRYPASPGGDALMVANADGTEEKILFTRKQPNLFSPSGPAWSPDGKTIACGNQNYSDSFYSNVVGVRVADGVEAQITPQRWDAFNIGRVAWLADGSGLIVTVSEQVGSLPQIWHLAYPDGDARRIVNDLNGYADVSVTADSGTLATVLTHQLLNIWVASGGEASRAKQITSGAERDDGQGGIDWTPDNKIVYRSIAGGNLNIWIIAADGTENKKLSVETGTNNFPAVSPNGRYIVWVFRTGTGVGQIWRMDIDGGNPKQLTSGGGGVWFPQFSPDGRWVVYGTIGGEIGYHSLWKVSIDGGAPIQLTEKPSWRPVVSPDGKMIACTWLDEASGQWKIAVIPFEGGLPIKILNNSGGYARRILWTPDGRAVAYIQTSKGVSNIWGQSLDGGEPRKLTDFKDQRIFNFAWSRDGKQLALSRGVVNSDVVLISGFK